jgi:hypothetical protein
MVDLFGGREKHVFAAVQHSGHQQSKKSHVSAKNVLDCVYIPRIKTVIKNYLDR